LFDLRGGNVTKKLEKSWILTGTIFLILICCTKYKEQTPFFDGLFLEYDLGSPGFKWTYNIHNIEDGKFRINETEEEGAIGKRLREYFVDSKGKVYKTDTKDYQGKFSPIWLPVHEMKIGDTFDNGDAVVRKDKWKKWEVLVIKDSDSNNERYFDVNTGYFVGSYESRATVVLINTNASIPFVEKSAVKEEGKKPEAEKK
jgi:hypothetical protein